jgi:hypothetical protein
MTVTRRRSITAVFIVPALMVVAGTSCHKKSENRGPAMNDRAQSDATLAQLAHEAGVQFPAGARLVGSAREDGIDDLLRFKVEVRPADLAAFLSTSPVPSDALESGEGGLLGPDQGFWDPSRAKRLRTGQKILPGQRALNIGIDDGRTDVVFIYVVNHGT